MNGYPVWHDGQITVLYGDYYAWENGTVVAKEIELNPSTPSIIKIVNSTASFELIPIDDTVNSTSEVLVTADGIITAQPPALIDVCSVSDLLENESNNGSMITASTLSSSNHGILYSNEGNQITLDGYTFVCATIIPVFVTATTMNNTVISNPRISSNSTTIVAAYQCMQSF